MSTNFYNAYDDFDFETKDGAETEIDVLETYKAMREQPHALEVSAAEGRLYGLTKDKKGQWVQPYPGCWRTVEQLREGDVETEENPELVRKVGKFKVPGVE